MTGLMKASDEGYADVVRLLLDNKADPNIPFKIDEEYELNGETALFFAARKGHVNIVKLLLDYGAEVDHKNWV